VKNPQILEVTVDKLVHGGQALGTLTDGRKAFVWNALPGERVRFLVSKKKRDWCEGTSIEIIETSPERVEPREPEIFTATSPWQIMSFENEAKYKQSILAESFEREHVALDWKEFYQDENEFGYRNKMEYNFWYFNETGKVSLALHKRGTHQKVAVKGSALASDAINKAGEALIEYINANNIEARPLKSVILRSDTSDRVGMSIFVNDPDIANSFEELKIENCILEILYSNPKSPASVATEILKPTDDVLIDKLLGREFKYSTRSFFQVNIPVYESVLKEIATTVQQAGVEHIVDLYSGVGSIGLSVVGDNQKLTMIEVSSESTEQAKLNMIGRTNCEIVTAPAEGVMEHVTGDELVILDPPRAGLHADVTKKLTEAKPTTIVYLSCNPSTQARDVALLVDAGYAVTHARGYNFFPRTPHIESLLVLKYQQ
jgi:23S rRNA (uracil1939-C5)-methyltransferase